MAEQPPGEQSPPAPEAAPPAAQGRRADKETIGSGQPAEQQDSAPTGTRELLNGGVGDAGAGPCVGASVDVYVGGLPEKLEDEALRTAFEAIGQVLEVSVARREGGECKGYATVQLPDHETADVACRMIRQIRNMPVGVHIKSGRQPGEPCSCSYKLPQFPLDPDPKASINALIRSLRAATDKKPAVTAAFKAAMEGMKRPHVESQQEDRNMVAEQPAAALLDMSSYLDSFAKCKSLMHSIRSSPGGENKTPLAVLHEYATRWNLEVSHEENSASNMGPFDVETKLTDNRGHTYATGAGRGRNKKDARQISAAATLNLLLETLSEDYFIQPGKAKQRSLQAGRGRGRSSAWNASGRGRGNNWTGCKWGLGYRGRSTRTVGQPAANRGSRGGIEAGQKRDYAAMLGLSGPSDINQNLQIQSPNLMGLVGGGMVQGGTALNPLLNQGIGLGAAGVGLPAMMTGVAMGGAAGTGLQRGMTNTIAGVTGNINGNNILGTVTMGGPQVGQQIGTLGAGNGSSQVNGLAWASSLNGATGGAIGLNGGTPALTLGTDGLMGVVGSMGLSGGQQTSMGLLNSAINNLSHVPMGQPNGTNLLGGANLGQQAQTGQFNF